MAGDRQKVESGASRSTGEENSHPAQSIAPADLSNGKQAVEPDCGTPKECRAEQREKDDLIAYQTSANAAVGQRNAAWWQTGVGAAGVLLLILTVIYTHLATRAAIKSVSTLIAVERARIVIQENDVISTRNGEEATFSMLLSNAGRSAGTLKETCITTSATGLYKDFKPENIKKHNDYIPTEDGQEFDNLTFTLGNQDTKFVVGYYKFSTIFSTKLVTDYFCYEVGDVAPLIQKARATENAQAETQTAKTADDGTAPRRKKRVLSGPLRRPVYVPSIYRRDLDWPPDQD